jgi:uncharacterized protein HemX
LKTLAAKYWQGETTLEEEEEIRRAARETPEFLSSCLVDLFLALDTESSRAPTLDNSFDERFWAEAEEDDPKVIGINFSPQFIIRAAAAAVVVVAMGLGLWYGLEEQNGSDVENRTASTLSDTYEDPEVAFEEAKKALSFASSKLNRGAEPITRIKKFHQATLSVTGESQQKNETKQRNDEPNE